MSVQPIEERRGPLTSLIHRVVAHPAIYDAVQLAAGVAYIDMRIKKAIARRLPQPFSEQITIIDVGGGTGRSRRIWPRDVRYILVDNDPDKIAGFQQKGLPGEAVCGDATALPFGDDTVDAAVLENVVHHLPPDVPPLVLAEIRRVLKPDGRLVLFEPIWRRWRPMGRFLWRFDRGSFPLPSTRIEAIVEQHFQLVTHEQFSIFHRYVLIIAKPRP
jgi:SAM-dependent methyltransferase